MENLIRYRYNPTTPDTFGEELPWRVIFERRPGSFEEVLVKKLYVNVPSFSQEDDLPVIGRRHHMACHGVFRTNNGIGTIDAR